MHAVLFDSRHFCTKSQSGHDRRIVLLQQCSAWYCYGRTNRSVFSLRFRLTITNLTHVACFSYSVFFVLFFSFVFVRSNPNLWRVPRVAILYCFAAHYVTRVQLFVFPDDRTGTLLFVVCFLLFLLVYLLHDLLSFNCMGKKSRCSDVFVCRLSACL